MGYVCVGKCKKYKEDGGCKFKRKCGNEDLYASGARRCQFCDGAWLDTTETWCPCCDSRLRVKPRKKELKEKIMLVHNLQRI